MIDFKNVYKIYPNKVTALRGASFQIENSEFVFLVGSSGAGKTTIIKLLSRELLPSKGKILVGDMDIARLKKRKVPFFRRKIGLVFQDYRLLNDRSVYENIAFALRVTETPRKEVKTKTMRALELVSLEDKAKAKPLQLSGGEQQRISLARAIVNQPPLLIADEPTGNLDPQTSMEIVNILRNINLKGTTVVIATHDKEIVNSLRKRVIEVKDGMIERDELRGGYCFEA